MKDASDSDDVEESFVGTNRASPGARNGRKEREDKIRQMMEDDEDEDGKNDVCCDMTITFNLSLDENAGKGLEDEDMDASQDSATIDKQELKKEQSPEPPLPVVSDGRRRGRRKVMKKKTIKDEEGYLGRMTLENNFLLSTLAPYYLETKHFN